MVTWLPNPTLTLDTLKPPGFVYTRKQSRKQPRRMSAVAFPTGPVALGPVSAVGLRSALLSLRSANVPELKRTEMSSL